MTSQVLGPQRVGLPGQKASLVKGTRLIQTFFGVEGFLKSSNLRNRRGISVEGNVENLQKGEKGVQNCKCSYEAVENGEFVEGEDVEIGKEGVGCEGRDFDGKLVFGSGRDGLGGVFGVDYELLDKFGVWLEKTKNAKIVLKKKGCEGWGFGIDNILVLNYQTRFKESYVRKTLRKFRLICGRYRDKPYVHLILTCYRSFPIPYAIRVLKEGWNKLRTYLVKRHGLLPYLAVLEPHKDGYPHLHVLVFTPKYLINQAQLSVLWQKYGVGRVVYLKRYWNWGRDSKGFQYLTKYVTKFFKDVPKVLKIMSGQTTDFKAVFLKRVVFYAWLWQGKVKTYSFSRSFSGLWIKKSSGEWELWVILWNEAMFERLLWFYGVRKDHLLEEFNHG